MESSDVRTLLDAEFSELQLTAQNSTVNFFDSGRVISAMKNFRAFVTVSFLYMSLVYSNLAYKQQRHSTYVEGIMGITVDESEKWSVKMYFKVRSCDGVRS